MKVLFVGPYPPPHGGISVHVWNARALMERNGVQCSVLNIDTRAPESDAYIRISGALAFLKELVRHVFEGWMLNVHTNGHNQKSWTIALTCGVMAQFGAGGSLMLHSGIAPDYLRRGSSWRRTLVRLTCLLYERVICVNEEIATVIASLGVSKDQLEIKPAFLPVKACEVSLPPDLASWVARHTPLLSATMFFRPEYGFDFLIRAVAVLRRNWPRIGCVVMGSGEDRIQAEALIRDRGLRETIYLSGDLDHESCLGVISRSSVFVRPTFFDGDSISVREALSLGVPVVASRVGTRPEGTLLFDVGDVTGLVAQIERALKVGK